jgi:hypothetical protein
MAPILNQAYHVIMGSWFSSPDLYDKLRSKQTDAMGTVRQNKKGVAVEIQKAELKKLGCVLVSNDEPMAVKYKNERHVCLAHSHMMTKWIQLGFEA